MEAEVDKDDYDRASDPKEVLEDLCNDESYESVDRDRLDLHIGCLKLLKVLI
jgi:hypothetical protein